MVFAVISLHRESRTHNLSPTHVPSWAFRIDEGTRLFEKKTKAHSQAHRFANILVVKPPA